MKLSEWSGQEMYAYGPQPWMRQMIVKAIGDLDAGEDPIVFPNFTGGTQEQPLVTIRAFVALTAGLGTATITTDPTRSENARFEIVIVPWSTIEPSLRLESAGDPEERLPVVVTIGEERIEARREQRPALTAFYLEASRLAHR